MNNKHINVLLVDDDEDDYLIIRRIINKIHDTPFHLEWVSDPDKAAQLIGDEAFDIYLVDYRLGEVSGLELLDRFDLVTRQEPFIVLTGAGDERVEKKAMRMGVADYLVKGSLEPDRLSRALHYALQRKRFEAQRIAQLMEINRSKDEFIALASHQLRTPATAVKQYIGMILEGYAGDVPPEQRRFLQSAYDSNERQIQVVNDILRVAKLDLKKIILKKQDTDTTHLVESIVHDMMSNFNGRDQQVVFNKPEQPITVPLDNEYIRMAIGNIVDNASKYTPEGKTITISIEKARSAAKIIVADEGVGIPEEGIIKLFRKFSRIENPLSVKVGGTGLGLYWANEIISLHGGNIDVSSEVGKGTTFTISLPTAPIEEKTAQRTAAHSGKKA